MATVALDLFSKQASKYAKFRPTYPESLYKFLASATPGRKLVWDVGTGNGQAAVELAKHFDHVVATDLSSAQLAHAQQRPNIRYAVSPPVMSPEELQKIVGPRGSVDLVTVAQAVHWFDLEAFSESCRVVLRRPGGVVAAWGYGLCRISPAFDEVFDEYYAHSRPYWEPQRRLVDEEYRTIAFDFKPLPGKEHTGPFFFESETQCTFEGFLGYLETQSALQTAKEKGVVLLTEELREKFAKVWGTEEVRIARWPVFMRIGTVLN